MTPDKELIGELIAQGEAPPEVGKGTATPIAGAISMFLEHMRAHSPQKPLTLQRYREVLEHFERLLVRSTQKRSRGQISTTTKSNGTKNSASSGAARLRPAP